MLIIDSHCIMKKMSAVKVQKYVAPCLEVFEIQIQSLMDNSPVLEDVEEGDIIGWDDEPTEG